MSSSCAENITGMCEDGSVVRGADYSPWHDQTLTKSEESRQLSVGISGLGIMRCGCIERKDQGTAR